MLLLILIIIIIQNVQNVVKAPKREIDIKGLCLQISSVYNHDWYNNLLSGLAALLSDLAALLLPDLEKLDMFESVSSAFMACLFMNWCPNEMTRNFIGLSHNCGGTHHILSNLHQTLNIEFEIQYYISNLRHH